jgi:hypothetical protein
MGIVSPGYAAGAAGQVLSGKLLRLAGGAPFRPSTGVQYVSGVLYGPAGTMGELALASNTSLTINPFTAVIQNTLDATAGPFLVTNDAAVTATTTTVSPVPAIPVQDASQFRRALIVTRKDDSQLSGVASSATTDRALLDIRAGALAASSAAAVLPAALANELALGELLIPPTGQTVTLTAYNPRTTTRGGILPVLADGATLSGHDGAPGTHVGHYRDHPTQGLQRWDGAVWGTPVPPGRLLARVERRSSAGPVSANTLVDFGAGASGIGSPTFTLTQQTRVQVQVHGKFSGSTSGGAARANLYLTAGSSPGIVLGNLVGMFDMIIVSASLGQTFSYECDSLLPAGTYTVSMGLQAPLASQTISLMYETSGGGREPFSSTVLKAVALSNA